MFRRILIPLDVARKNGPALAAAAELAREHKSEVLLLHVIEQIEQLPENELGSFYRQLEAAARRELAAAAESFTPHGVPTSTHVRIGHRSEIVVRFAIENAVDLIVMRSHRYDPQTASYPIGTLSHQVATLAQCAVLLVK